MNKATELCESQGGELFYPLDANEANSYKPIAIKLGVKWNTNKIWMGVKRKDTSSRDYPPLLVKNTGFAAPAWIEKTLSIWGNNIKRALYSNYRQHLQYVRSLKGKWGLSRSVHSCK